MDVYDPRASKEETYNEYGIALIDEPDANAYDAIIFAVAHQEIIAAADTLIENKARDNRVIYDLKHMVDQNLSDIRL